MPYTSKPKQELPNWYRAYAANMASNFPDLTQTERQTEFYKRLSWVGTAVDIVATIGAMAGKSVKEMRGETTIEIKNHPLELLLLDPNPLHSGRSFIFGCLANYQIYNRCYIWMNIVNGKPVELWNIPTSRIIPRADGNLGIHHYDYWTGTNWIPIPPEEIVHIKGYDPDNMIESTSLLQSLSLTAANDMQMQRWSLNTYSGSGRLPGVMTFADIIPDTQWAQIGEDIDNAARNQNILRLRGTGTGAVNWIQTSSPPKDMEFYIGRQNNRDEIWSRLAPGLVSLLSENATEANSRTGKAILTDFKVYPLLLMFYETITQQVVWRYYGRNLVLEPEDIRITDRVLELSEIDEYSKTHTMAEVRKNKWNDMPLNDERDNMLPSQANNIYLMRQSDPTPAPALPAETSNPQPDMQTPAKARDIHPVMVELEKWQRQAGKNKNRAVDFICYNVPSYLEMSIKADLPKCASSEAVKAVFDAARAKLAAPEPALLDGLLAVAQAINNAVERNVLI